MKRLKFSVILSVALALSRISVGQTIEEGGNWYKETRGLDDYYSQFDFNKYSKSDVVKAVRKYKQIEQNKPNAEWEGLYLTDSETGNAELHWNGTDGYVFYYVYHTLASLDFGSSENSESAVRLISESSQASKASMRFSSRLVKVKFGSKHFLVPEKHLSDFGERAAGRETSLYPFWTYWQKKDEIGNNVFGLPEFPKQYSRFLKRPIVTQIKSIGRRTIYQDKFDDGSINFEEIHLQVTLRDGSNKRIKPGMDFFVDSLGEWIEILKVKRSSSVGRIVRRFSETGQDECWDSEKGSGNPIPCNTIELGLPARTLSNF